MPELEEEGLQIVLIGADEALKKVYENARGIKEQVGQLRTAISDAGNKEWQLVGEYILQIEEILGQMEEDKFPGFMGRSSTKEPSVEEKKIAELYARIVALEESEKEATERLQEQRRVSDKTIAELKLETIEWKQTIERLRIKKESAEQGVAQANLVIVDTRREWREKEEAWVKAKWDLEGQIKRLRIGIGTARAMTESTSLNSYSDIRAYLTGLIGGHKHEQVAEQGGVGADSSCADSGDGGELGCDGVQPRVESAPLAPKLKLAEQMPVMVHSYWVGAALPIENNFGALWRHGDAVNTALARLDKRCDEISRAMANRDEALQKKMDIYERHMKGGWNDAIGRDLSIVKTLLILEEVLRGKGSDDDLRVALQNVREMVEELEDE